MRIAVIRLSSLGDIVLTSPATRALKAHYPDAELEFITTPHYRDLAASLPGVSEVRTVSKKKHRFSQDIDKLKSNFYDKVVDLQGSRRSSAISDALEVENTLRFSPPRIRRAIHLTLRIKIGKFPPVPDRYLATKAPWGVKPDGNGLELKVADELTEEVGDRYPVLRESPLILIPGSQHNTKMWILEYWDSLLERVLQDHPVVLLGGDDPVLDEIYSRWNGKGTLLNLRGKTNILEAYSVLTYAACTVAVDTGPMHLAVATGKPLVALFGPSVKEFGFMPYLPKDATVLEHTMRCRPCHPHGRKACPLLHHNCMRRITPDMVYEAVRSKLV